MLRAKVPLRGVHPGGMTHAALLKFQGGKWLEILYDVMQQPVGHNQSLEHLVHQGRVDFCVQNALKCTYKRL